MVMLEDFDPFQDAFCKSEPIAAPPPADDEAVDGDKDKSSGDLASLDKDFAVLFGNMVITLMLFLHTAPLLSPPKPDDRKEQEQDKIQVAENDPPEKTPQTPPTSMKNTLKKNRSKKPKPTRSQKKRTAQKIPQAPSAFRNNILSKFLSLVACMIQNVLRAPKCSHFFNRPIIWITLYLMLFAFSVQIVVSAPTTDIEIDPTLPVLCKNDFHQMQQCPGIDSDKLNRVCCGSFPATVLHCLSHFDENRQKDILKVACFPDTVVAPGHVIDITFKNGLPQKNLIPCEPGFFEPNIKNSSQIRHPYCGDSQTGCLDEDGRQPLCQGGTAIDNQCICMPGFEPRHWNTSQSPCAQGFSHRDMCDCVEARCPHGQMRNIDYLYNASQQCPTQRIRVNYTCVKTEKTSTAPYLPTKNIENTTQEIVTRTLRDVTLTPNDENIPEGQKNFPYFLLLVFAATLTLFTLGVAVYKCKFSNTGYHHLARHN